MYENRDGSRLVAGINGNAGKAKADIHSSLSDGDIDTDAYGLGATLTWYDHSGFYADFQAKYNWRDTPRTLYGSNIPYFLLVSFSRDFILSYFAHRCYHR